MLWGMDRYDFLACKQILHIPNLAYNDVRSPRPRAAWRGAGIFRREAGDAIKRGG